VCALYGQLALPSQRTIRKHWANFQAVCFRPAIFQLFPYQILSHSFWYKIFRSGQFLSETFVKAGVSPDAWKHGAKLEAFTAEVFGEE
jgi:hypothetical protein